MPLFFLIQVCEFLLLLLSMMDLCSYRFWASFCSVSIKKYFFRITHHIRNSSSTSRSSFSVFLFLQTDKNGCAKFTIKTKALELDESVNSIVVIGEMEEIGTGTEESVRSFITCSRLLSLFEIFWLWPSCSSSILNHDDGLYSSTSSIYYYQISQSSLPFISTSR